MDAFSIGRKLLKIPANVSSGEAVAIARQASTERGWTWIEPVHVKEQLRNFKITTNFLTSGGDRFFIVDIRTGLITKCGNARE